MSERSILRVAQRQHIHPDRKEDTIIEVWRDGKIVATIYGSREGIHIVSERFHNQQPLPLFLGPEVLPQMAENSWAIPMLHETEACPWCQGTGVIVLSDIHSCLLCQRGRGIGPLP